MEQNEVQGIKISQLDELTSIQDDDVLASVDTSEIKTTKVKASTLKSYINKEVNNEITTIKNDYALKTSIPTKTSQLNNDSGFIDKSVNNLDNYYKKTEIDTKVQTINTTTNGLNTRLTTAEKNIETNKNDIKDLSNRTKRIETDIFDSGEASGTGINLQDSTLAEFQEVKIDGVGNQVTTNGNQILDLANPSFKSVGVTSTFENDILTIVGNAGSTYQSVTWKLSKTFLEKNKGKTIKYKHKSAKISNQEASSNVQISVGYTDDTPIFYRRIYDFNTQGTDTYVIPSDISNISYINVGIYTNNSANTDVENTITIEEPLLYFDDNDTYEPYTGAEPSPSPDYKQPIEVIEEDFELVSCGKNLYYNDKDIITFTSSKSNWKYVDGTEGADSSNSSKTIYKAKVKKGESYTFGANVNATSSIVASLMYDTNIQINRQDGSDLLFNVTFTSLIDGYVLLRFYANEGITVTTTNLMLEKGSTATSYEPYTETRQTITMPEGEFAGKIDNTYKDQFRINYNEEDGKYHLYLDKVVGKKVLNGSETWASLSGETKIRYYTGINNMKPINFAICDYFIKEETSEYFKPKTFRIAPSGAISFCYDNVMSLEEFKQWLSTHNTEVYYVLAEPYTLDLGVVNMPLSYYPITNIYNTCVGIPNMYVKYYRDFKGTIKTMQVDIENLKEAVSTLTSNQTSMDNDISTLQNVVSSSLEGIESEVTNDDNLQGQ